MGFIASSYIDMTIPGVEANVATIGVYRESENGGVTYPYEKSIPPEAFTTASLEAVSILIEQIVRDDPRNENKTDEEIQKEAYEISERTILLKKSNGTFAVTILREHFSGAFVSFRDHNVDVWGDLVGQFLVPKKKGSGYELSDPVFIELGGNPPITINWLLHQMYLNKLEGSPYLNDSYLKFPDYGFIERVLSEVCLPINYPYWDSRGNAGLINYLVKHRIPESVAKEITLRRERVVANVFF